MERLSALALVLASWAVLGLLLVGVGRLVRRSVFHRERGQDPGDDLWIGYATTIAALQLVHLLWPVGPVVFVVWSVAGLLGLSRVGGTRRPLFARMRGRRLLVFLGLTAILAFFGTCSADANYDGGLYHFTTVRWTRELPIVPGLTNLHFRLGFNNASFLWCALVAGGPWGGLAVHVAQGVLFLPLLLRAATGASTLLRARGTPRARHLYWVLVAPLVFHPALTAPASFTPDVVVTLLTFELLGRLPALARAATSRTRQTTYVLAVLLPVVKLSGVFLAGAAAALALARSRARRRDLGFLGGAVLVLALPWAVRGVILSGGPAYPSTALSLDVDWRADERRAAGEVLWIRAWARGLRRVDPEELSGWSWLGPWARSTLTRSDVLLPLGFVVVAWIGRRRPAVGWLAVAPAAVGLSAWFVLAPDPRFAHGLLWGLPALLASEAACVGAEARSRARGLCLLAAFFAAHVALLGSRTLDATGTVDAPPFPPLPVAVTREVRTASGLVVFAPVGDARCYDAPLPCTPDVDPRLRLRRPGDLSAGFSIR